MPDTITGQPECAACGGACCQSDQETGLTVRCCEHQRNLLYVSRQGWYVQGERRRGWGFTKPGYPFGHDEPWGPPREFGPRFVCGECGFVCTIEEG